jgi:hypothetical protein
VTAVNAAALVTDDSIEASARVYEPELWAYLDSNPGQPGSPVERMREKSLGLARRVLEPAAPHILASATSLIADLTDSEECSFDHHGGCQAHGYLSLQPGETCPQHDAKEWAKTFGGEA